MTVLQLRQELRKLANKDKAVILSRFFKTGKGEYGEGDKFLGVVVPEQRRLVKEFVDEVVQNQAVRSRTSSEPEVRLRTVEIQNILQSPFHEERLTGLLILVELYKRAKKIKDEKSQKNIFNFYLKNIPYINNWDLVDLSAPNIVGDYIFNNFLAQSEAEGSKNKNKTFLFQLAKSKNIWARRVAILATFTFIRNNRFEEILELSQFLLIKQKEKHDLMHKAIGWMLREVGKRDKKVLEKFLNKFSNKIPRTTLRYAIEKFSEVERKKYLAKK